MNEITVEVETEVHQTEEEKKVRRAVENVFPNLSLSRIKGEGGVTILKGEAKGLESLENLRRLLKRERIRDAARGILLSSVQGEEITFHLNKQVAFSSRISFCQPVSESPLGPISVKIKSKDSKKLIDWLAPSSSR
ncbi:TPA: hypothetical protein EYP26_00480 [Candidatus Bathyarchaeota archaeon]|nr:hypothetical protein [Candidatus Bathyarchaeota archaeon]